MKTVSLKEMIAREPPAVQRQIAARTKELIAEEMTLRALRKAAGKTQVAVAAELGLKQENVCRIEKRADLLLSTLGRFVRAVGGNLRLTADFVDGRSVQLSGFADLSGSTAVVRKAAPRGLGVPGKARLAGDKAVAVAVRRLASKRKSAGRAVQHAK